MRFSSAGSRAAALLAAALGLASASRPAAGQCDLGWADAFGSGIITGGEVFAATQFDDDGPGPMPPSLYIGGSFTDAGGAMVSKIARWDGASWRAAGVTGTVRSMAVLDDDGPGPNAPAMFVGGEFLGMSGIFSPKLVRWDGQAWSGVGGGVGPAFSGVVRAMAIFDDDGPGPIPPALYVAGTFTTAGNPAVPVAHVARWDGETWTDVGGGMSGSVVRVNALTTYDADGEGPLGPVLVASGVFTGAGGVAATNIASWDGESWSAVGTGTGGEVFSLATFSAPGPGGAEVAELYAGGLFGSAGGVTVPGIAKWNGSEWQRVGAASSPGARINAMRVLDVDGEGPIPRSLIVAGSFNFAGGVAAPSAARWDGTAWHALSPEAPIGDGPINAVAEWDPDGIGQAPPRLVIAGQPNTSLGGPAPVAQLEGTTWRALNGGPGWQVASLAVFDEDAEGPGLPALFAGGYFNVSPSVGPRMLQRWDGREWKRVDGVGGTEPTSIRAMVVHDADGPGPAVSSLYMGGAFAMTTSGTPMRNIARWDGTNWGFLGVGTSGEVRALATFDEDGDGPGLPALFAGGNFSTAGGVQVAAIGRWNGIVWTALGEELEVDSGLLEIEALLVFDAPGSGPVLVAGGRFDRAGGEPAVGIAAWDGATWSPLGTPPWSASSTVRALAAFDADGPGPGQTELYAAGSVTGNLLRWDGQTWTPVPGAPGTIFSMAVLDDDGDGRESLFVGGSFTTVNGVPRLGIAKWDQQSWGQVDLGGGLTGPGGVLVSTLAAVNEPWLGRPDEAALYVGGRFRTAGGHSADNLARWGRGVPWIRRQPADVEAESGGSAVFTLGVTAAGPIDLQWRRDGVDLVEGGVVSGSRSPTLSLAGVRRADEGVYDVVIASACGDSVSLGAALLVRCSADWNNDQALNSGDISAFLTEWLASLGAGTLEGDFNGDQSVDSVDISAFLSAWLDAVGTGC